MEFNRQPIYPIEPWSITEEAWSMETNYRNETTFSLSNGYLGTRGTLEEGYDFTVEEGLEGNYINGFYESEKIRYGEWNYGFPTDSQSLLNLPDCKRIRLFVGNEEMDLRRGTVSEYRRTLHMDQGILRRSFVWTSERGNSVLVEIARMVSFRCEHVMEIRYQVTPLNYDGEVTFVSVLNGAVENHTKKTNPLVDYGPFGSHLKIDTLTALDEMIYCEGTAVNSGLTMACGCSHRVMVNNGVSQSSVGWESRVFPESCSGETRITVPIGRGQKVVLDKIIAYTSSLSMERSSLHSFIAQVLGEAKEIGWEREEESQISYMKQLWRGCDVTIEGDDALQQGIRFNLFHIMQSAPRDGKHGMGAKGLSGEGYEGHYFWDTEMYVIPVLVFTNPSMAKSLLEFRYRTLDQARDRARVLGHESGALYPWRTINGMEASTYFPLGTAQYHINADIAYAFKLYVDVTGDMEFFRDRAVEVLVETARVWADVGCFAESKGGKYCICAVTGPDEYNAIVDNNFYTNLMARENIRDARWALHTLKAQDEKGYQGLLVRLGIRSEELKVWDQIIERMYFPYDESRQIYALDDGFMQRKPWDESKTPPEKRHLLYENYHPLFIFRQRMSKQADAILGMYLHSNLFTKEELRRNYDFYQEVTLHHSSLSTCIFGILACQIGYQKEAYGYFSQSARMDLDDSHHNFYAGIHAANMAGSWMAIVNGFAGMRTNRGYLELSPSLPEQLRGYGFYLNYCGNLVYVKVGPQDTTVTLMKGAGLSVTLADENLRLEKEGDYVTGKTQSDFL